MTRSPVLLALTGLLTACQYSSGPVQQAAQASSLDPVRAALQGPPNPVWTAADEQILGPTWVGDDDHGALYLPLWRGAAAGIEDYVWAPPDGDCRNLKGTARLDWDSAANTVHVLIKWRDMPTQPVVHRTEGVDFFPNSFHDAPMNIDVGAYRFWTILSSVQTFANFYYSYSDLHLVGSQYDFPDGQPQGTLAVPLPVFAISATHLIHPNADGSMEHEYTVPYDHFTVEGGAFSFAYFTYVPQDLCESSPVQLARSQLRPYATHWFPASQGINFRTMLHSGISFDTTVDDASNAYPDTDGYFPYVVSGVAFIGNIAAVQGGIPNGWRISLPSAITQNAPPIRAVPGGNAVGCATYVVDPHLTGPNFCALGQ